MSRVPSCGLIGSVRPAVSLEPGGAGVACRCVVLAMHRTCCGRMEEVRCRRHWRLTLLDASRAKRAAIVLVEMAADAMDREVKEWREAQWRVRIRLKVEVDDVVH